MNTDVLMSILLFTPLVGFLINGLRYRKPTAILSGSIATAAAAIPFIAAILLFVELQGREEGARQIVLNLFDWIHVGTLNIKAEFMVDQVSALMILVITGVGSLIHLFSVGYMSHDAGVTKYFAYLNLFLFNMLILVLGTSLPVMFVGWEGVGLCSYLLIGYWFTDDKKAAAGMKAFIANRVGDAAFLIGMFILFMEFGTLNFYELNAAMPADPMTSWINPITLGTLFLFIGATGKSAQIPLYVWLPDAMAGPTPVSALIHAATMVTAGVYMIVRLNAVFLTAPQTLFIVAIIGAATAVFAATIGLLQNDIKKVLAYSTVSQLGYMFLACGVGAFGAGMFHLMTHAFFKALMFLGSGSVIHAMHEEQDIRKMGGLKKYLPITHWTFVIGWIAIIGLPPFAGFFSKDELLLMSFHSPLGHPALWVFGAIGATLTAFYMTRLMALTFWGKSRVPKDIHPHESPAVMTIPLIALAILSAVGGFMGIPHVLGEILPGHPHHWLEHWLAGVVKPIPNMAPVDATLEFTLMGISVFLAAVSSFVAYHFYVRSPETPVRLANSMSKLHKVIYNKYYVDEIYDASIINPTIKGSEVLWYRVDVKIIDKATYLLADLTKGAGGLVRSLQNGNIQQYAMYLSLGVIVALGFLMAG
ncbi:MAG: NADH-quinone oxidoreductase subunit L [Bdellovibrionaceae bacterium]|nr:NADH-quinone oxidoreductase subunit L [Pseudobdellovibrionaceae bacterium]